MNNSSWIESDVKVVSSTIGERSWIRKYSSVVATNVGSDVFIGYACKVMNAYINNFVQIAGKTDILGNNDAPIHIASFVWIGVDARIMPGVSIGKGAVIGAGTVVTNDVPPFQIVVGSPARFLKMREVHNQVKPAFSKFMNFIRSHPENPTIIVSKSMNNHQAYLQADIDVIGSLSVGKNTIMDGKQRGNMQNGGIQGGGNITIGSKCLLETAGGLHIAGNLCIGKNCTVETMNHDYSFLSLPQQSQKIEIGENVSIGDNTIVLAGAKIVADEVIPANSIVLKDKVISRKRKDTKNYAE